jgi:hypothetical protein
MVFLLIVRFDDNHLPKQPQTIEKALAAQILAKTDHGKLACKEVYQPLSTPPLAN